MFMKAGEWIPLKYWTSEVRAVLKSLEHTCNNPATVQRNRKREKEKCDDRMINFKITALIIVCEVVRKVALITSQK